MKLGVARALMPGMVHNPLSSDGRTRFRDRTNGDGTLSLDEIVAGADKICMLIGIDVAETSVGKERLPTEAHRRPARFAGRARALDAG